ncbi:MAG: methyltransferase domain-containing protein [Candidatus Andersenbacteria bacterium]
MSIENPHFEKPKDDKEKLVQFYDQLYSKEGAAFAEGEPEAIVEKIPVLMAGGRALDIGAGEGRNSLVLARNGFEVTAIDPSPKGISKIQATAETEKLPIQTILGDTKDVPLNETYEAIVSALMLHHLPEDGALVFIEQIKQQTRTEGLNAIVAVTKEGDFYRNNPDTVNFYPDVDALRQLYNGWEILEYKEEERQYNATREDGSPMRNVTVSLLARKPAG